MALTFFEEIESTSGTGDKLFCNEFLTANPRENGKQFPVHNIRLVKSGKGYMLETDYFFCWVWKKSKIAGYLIEAIELYISSGKGYTLFAVADKTTKDGYRLAIDPEMESYWYELGNGSYSTQKPSCTETSTGNPFLPVALSPSIPTGETLTMLNGRTGGEATGTKGRKAS